MTAITAPAQRPPRKRRPFYLRDSRLLLLPAVLFQVMFFLVPLLIVGAQSLFDPGLTFVHYVETFTNPISSKVLVQTGARPGILAGALFAFLTSFDELLISLFVSGTRAVTLPRLLWDFIRTEASPVIAVVSTLLMAGTIVFIGILALVRRERD